MDPITAALITGIINFGFSILTHGPAALRKVIDAQQQAGALSDADAEQYRAQLAQMFNTPAWQRDAQIDASAGGTATGGDATGNTGTG